MGAIAPITSGLSAAVSTLNTVGQVVGAVQTLSGNSAAQREQDLALRQLGEDLILDAPPPLVSGDIRVRALGWQNDATAALWRIEQSDPLAFTLLSVTAELKVND
ncbi:MAG: hypothetical protein H6861_02010 [Rhodospirillales bacterium]|nr:hypothetical protein [Rhodospirillales bacterium]